MILQANLKNFNALVIGQSIHSLNNRLVDHYGKIKAIQKMKSFFLVGNKDLSIINFDSDFESATFAMTCDVVTVISTQKNWGYNHGDTIKLIYRVEVDKQKPIEMEWVTFDNGIATKKEYFKNDAIQNGKMLVIGAGSNSTRDFTFSLLGYKKAYERLEKECLN